MSIRTVRLSFPRISVQNCRLSCPSPCVDGRAYRESYSIRFLSVTVFSASPSLLSVLLLGRTGLYRQLFCICSVRPYLLGLSVHLVRPLAWTDGHVQKVFLYVFRPPMFFRPVHSSCLSPYMDGRTRKIHNAIRFSSVHVFLVCRSVLSFHFCPACPSNFSVRHLSVLQISYQTSIETEISSC